MSAKDFARSVIKRRMPEFSDWSAHIWELGETAWREYQSAAFYVDLLRKEGFEVETGSAGMPTAFCATWSNGDGPTIGGYAEYDGIPGNCQAATPHKAPRDGLSEHAGGHTDPHSALGVSALAGFLATKAAMQEHNIPGKLKFFGADISKFLQFHWWQRVLYKTDTANFPSNTYEGLGRFVGVATHIDRKSTRLNSSHPK